MNAENIIFNEDNLKFKFLNKDIEDMTIEELISLILNPNCKYSSNFEKLKKTIKSKKYEDLSNISFDELKEIEGIGKNGAIRILSSIELGRRVYYDIYSKKIKLSSAEKIFEYMKDELKDKKQEYFYALYLDSKKFLIEKKLLFMGTLNKSLVHPREIFKYAYLLSASSIVCVHNHPSGYSEPSEEDCIVTKKLINLGNMNDIKISDHVIVGNNYFSFFESGMI